MSIENIPDSLVNNETLTPVVRRMLGDDTAELGDWQLRHVQGGVGGGLETTSVHRLEGKAKITTGSVTWSVILKILNRHGDNDPAGSHYWRREADAYQSGVLGVGVGEYFAYAIFNWLSPFTTLIFAAFRIKIKQLTNSK